MSRLFPEQHQIRKVSAVIEYLRRRLCQCHHYERNYLNQRIQVTPLSSPGEDPNDSVISTLSKSNHALVRQRLQSESF